MSRILVVEDQPSQRFIMSELLERTGHESRCAADPRLAIEVAETFNPDVLVADWRLRSELNGCDVARILRKRNPELKLVFITAMPPTVIEHKAKDLAPYHTVRKPCEFYDLLRAIHEALGDVPEEALS